ncbi:SPOR domain-containing protein [Pseudohaliea rubra]|uniref:DedD protein n=1 Tax=Pseudohaliea rubra DSM 19751 TaxID=1265313 RepID=A0A095VN45_9GAMM|nr:SPOR domain-containing protein [Pseudohaliea rubra]KGE02800.1 DedD protein [Pseudohaliea rubra DSM 19751]
MDNVLKQRLVGALILVALGIVFWPIIFVPPEEARLREGIMAPPPPAVSREPLPAPSDAGLRGSPEREPPPAAPDVALPAADAPGAAAPGEAAAEPAPVPLPSSEDPYPTRDKAPEVAAFDDDGLPVAWVLQVATVSSAEKARKLRDELIGSGEKAFYEPLRRDGTTLYRVYVGPKFERARLGPVKVRVDARYGVKSLVSRYVP